MKSADPLVPWWLACTPRLVLDAMRRQIGRSVPFARLLGIEIEVLCSDGARTRLAHRPQLANHVGSLHAGALFGVCEAAAGAALAGATAAVIMRTRIVVCDARIDYLKPAQGDVQAQARLAEDGTALLQRLLADGRAEAEVDVGATCCTGEGTQVLVARASFRWHLRLQPSS
jgi:uncharacterized protein (TIGR00369 family)